MRKKEIIDRLDLLSEGRIGIIRVLEDMASLFRLMDDLTSRRLDALEAKVFGKKAGKAK